MSKVDPAALKKARSKTIRWVVTIFLVTIVISGTISFISDEVMSKSGIFTAFLILLTIIFIGIVFDIIGMAVATADEKPFHSMAARKVYGAQASIRLLRNAERVSSICNDVVGDICGVVSGSASATIAALVMQSVDFCILCRSDCWWKSDWKNFCCQFRNADRACSRKTDMLADKYTCTFSC